MAAPDRAGPAAADLRPFLTRRRRAAYQHEADTLLALRLVDEASTFAAGVRERLAGRQVVTVRTERV